MNRKIWALICFALSLGLHVWLQLDGRADGPGWLLWPLVVGVTAFILPGMGTVLIIERCCMGLDPWGDGHGMTTWFYSGLASCFIWFFPAARIARWFGSFDAFGEGKRRRPVLVRGVAHALDALNKRLFGRQKTGGWA